MSRRDIMIVCVLINSGLLAILFMLAVRTETIEEIPFRLTAEVEPILAPNKEIDTTVSLDQKTTHDELDQVFQRYTYTTSHSSPSPQEEKTLSKDFVEVIVKQGDYLEKIARHNKTTVGAIMQANQLSNVRIDVGQILRVPTEVEERKSTGGSQPLILSEGEARYYTLKTGDNPWNIAKMFHVRFDELLKINSLNEERARHLKPGDVLRVE